MGKKQSHFKKKYQSLRFKDDFRACLISVPCGLLQHHFFDNKEKRRRHTDVWQVFLTQLAEKCAKKPCGAKILNRLLCLVW